MSSIMFIIHWLHGWLPCVRRSILPYYLMAPANHWSVPALASWWHDQPHRYLDNGGTVDEIFNDPEHWGYSLAFIASCVATVAVAVIVWDLVIRLIGSCCCSCFCSKSRKNGYDGIYGEEERNTGGYCSSDGWMGSPAKPGHKCRWSFACVLIILAIAAFSMPPQHWWSLLLLSRHWLMVVDGDYVRVCDSSWYHLKFQLEEQCGWYDSDRTRCWYLSQWNGE